MERSTGVFVIPRERAVNVAVQLPSCYQSYAMGSGASKKTSAVAHAALEHMDALYRVAFRMTGSATSAEDLLQETYARALGSERTFESTTNLRAWLFKILRNAYIDSARRLRRNPVAMGLDDDLTTVVADPLRGDEELDLLKGIVSSDIERALQCLPPDASSIILLDLEGFTETELAVALECPLGTIKSRLARARLALRKILCDYAR